MTKKFKFLYFVMFTSLLGAMCMAVAGGDRYLIAALLLASFCVSLFLVSNWMSYVKSLVSASDEVLHHDVRDLGWSFANLERLKKNHTLIREKFTASAAMIADLTHPERITATKSLEGTDPISKALTNIRAEMLKIKSEEDKRTWITKGITHFGEILRDKTAIEEYGQTIISNLVTYIGASQGGLFIEYQNEKNERYLQLTGCYAYGKRKQTDSRVEEGQGLIGQCMLEKEFVIMTSVPESYIKIKSGLGEITPAYVVVAPLIFKGTFCGVIELAFIDAIEAHHMEFLKTICESIASEIVALKHVEHAEKLLGESTILTHELQSREEIMKHNLEELAATQEEMSRKQTELTGIINAIDSTLATAEFGLDGNLKDANDIFLKVMGFSKEELTGTLFPFLMGEEPAVIMMWENLRLGRFFSGEFKMRNKAGKELWLTGTFNPITIEKGAPEKIMMLAQFTTQEKEKLNDLTTMVNALKSTFPVIEFNADFSCKTANDKALKIFGLSRLDLRSKTLLDFLAPKYHFMWFNNSESLLRTSFSNFLLPFQVGAAVMPYDVSMSVTRNLDGSVGKVIVILVKEVEERILLEAM